MGQGKGWSKGEGSVRYYKTKMSNYYEVIGGGLIDYRGDPVDCRGDPVDYRGDPADYRGGHIDYNVDL